MVEDEKSVAMTVRKGNSALDLLKNAILMILKAVALLVKNWVVQVVDVNAYSSEAH
jgi:hypothetical protein